MSRPEAKSARGTLRALDIVRPQVSRSVSLATSALPGRTRACEAIGRLVIELSRELEQSGAWRAARRKG